MDSIPNEILSEIFKESIHWDSTYPHFIYPTLDYEYYKGTPFALTYVCSNWRQLALCDQSLWNTITISSGSSGPGIWPNARRIDLWFDRAGETAPLTVFFDLQALDYSGISEDLWTSRCFKRFISLAPRWKRVLLGFPSSEFPSRIAVRLPDLQPATELQYLETIYTLKNPLVYLYPWILHVVETSPNLQLLCLNHSNGKGDRDTRSIFNSDSPRFYHLRHLRIAYDTSLDTVIDILKKCPNLISASIRNILYSPLASVFNDDTNPPPIYLLPRLKHLQLQVEVLEPSSASSAFAGILNRITAPRLVDLSLNGDEHWDAAALAEFLSRSQCTLDTLSLHGSVLSALDTLSALSANPFLTRFTGGHPPSRTRVANPGVSPADEPNTQRLLDALQEFSPEIAQWCLAPRLEELTLDFNHLAIVGADSSDSSSSAFLLSMRIRLTLHPSANRLRRLGLSSASQFITADMERFGREVRADLENLDLCPGFRVVWRSEFHEDVGGWIHARNWLTQ